MDTNPSITLLANDPAREAVDSMRGYSYQVLRSIEAWLDLGEGQVLFLEGAEDLDRIGSSAALVEQVKDTAGSGSITLRSPNVIAAIGNFWQHSERNLSTAIYFRYLTTSGIGRERGEDLPLPSPGIEIWEQVRRSPSEATSLAQAKVIQDFLATRDELPQSLLHFLKNAPVEAFISRIVEPFEWVTSQPGEAALRARLETRILELGEGRGITAASAGSVLAKLHMEAWANVTDKNRPPLRRGDFLRILDAAGQVGVPLPQLLALMKQLTGQAAEQTPVAHVDAAIVKPPRPPRRWLSRPRLESAMREALFGGTVLIHGSTGMGKTILASAAAQFSPALGWMDLRDLAQPAVGARLAYASRFVEEQSSAITIVLDDLDAGGDPRSLLAGLDRLTASLKAKKGGLLITSANRLPWRIAASVQLSDDRTFAAPSFEAEEISAYLVEAGCPAGDAETWSKIIFASTTGHPQLVDARIAALQQQSWPKPSIVEWLSPPSELVDVRAEARRMVSALPADERELLCRASLVIGRISRARLVAVGQISPPLAEPGNTIDRLTGPWLEVTDTSDLRVSPLLRNLGIDTHGQSWSTEMHGSIAWAWLADRSLSASDVSTLLMHAVLSRRVGPLLHILPSLLDAPDEVWRQIGETANLFVMIGVEEGKDLPFPGAMERAVFRILQLRIAEEADPGRLPAIIRRGLREADGRRSDDIGTSFFDFLFMWHALRLEIPEQEVETVVDVGLRFMRLAARIRDALATFGQEAREVAESWPDLTPIIVLSLLQAIPDVDRFVELLDAVERLERDDRRYLLPGASGDVDATTIALERLWLSELQKIPPDWARLVAVLDRTIEVAVDANVLALADAAAALLVRVTDEDLKNPEAALAAAESAAARLENSGRLMAAKAKVLWRSGEVEQALKIYDRILPTLSVQPSYLAGIFREAAIAAARAKSWPLCASRFGQAVSNLTEEDAVDRHVGFLFDLGLALHLAGDTPGAIETFGTAVNLLLDDGREMPPEPLLSIRQLGSQAMKFVLADLKGERGPGIGNPQSFVGAASAIDTLKWDDQQRPASLAMLVNQLLELELIVPADLASAKRHAEWIRNSSDSLTLATSGDNFTSLAIVTSDMTPLVSDTIRELSHLLYLASERDAGRDLFAQGKSDPPVQPLTDSTEIIFVYRFLAAIVKLMADGSIDDLPLRRWRADLPSDASYDRLRNFLSQVESVLFGPSDPGAQLLGTSPSWQIHAVVALGALGRDRTPAELIVAQSLAAHYLNQLPLATHVADPFSELVTRAWARLCDVPALLVTPKLSVPAIRQAIETTGPGWARTKAILLASLRAVPSGTARMVRDSINTLPDKGSVLKVLQIH
ncbi:hypothetical protein [Sinorhizobium medicae]|nr:hypothetical protein [Sinorhizobium medicae]